MTTVAILPVESDAGPLTFEAVAGQCVASGETAGEALDALTERFPEVGDESLVLVQRFRGDSYFSGEQQRRLQELMQRRRTARDGGVLLVPTEGEELERLIEAEIIASGRRAADAATRVGL